MSQARQILPHNFTPRFYQLPLLRAMDSGFKRACWIVHRRGGKDKTLINLVAKKSAERIGAYYYFFPTYNQGRKILWDGMDKSGFKFLSHFPDWYVSSVNKTEMKLEFVNGSLLQVIGTDNYNSIMGTNPVGCVFSEFALQDPRAWDYIRPILRENGGWAVFNYTPRGKNHGHDLYVMAKDNPDWFCELLTVDDTGAITPEEIERERKDGMEEDLIRQEYYCDFESSVPGAIYGNQMRLARTEGRITKVPYQTGIPVDTWWDLGMDDSTTIWFSQDCGREVHFIGYYEMSGEGFDHYALHLQERQKKWNCVWGRHVAPHDISNRELGPGKSRLQTARELGIRFEVASRVARKEDGIHTCRKIFRICWFDEIECKRGLECLSNYRREWNEKNRIWQLEPVHDWSSHGADGFQTFAISHRFTASGVKRSESPPRNAAGWT